MNDSEIPEPVGALMPEQFMQRVVEDLSELPSDLKKALVIASRAQGSKSATFRKLFEEAGQVANAD